MWCTDSPPAPEFKLSSSRGDNIVENLGDAADLPLFSAGGSAKDKLAPPAEEVALQPGPFSGTAEKLHCPPLAAMRALLRTTSGD
mmetsp:Transcript_102970/g.290875  ORF Transcript_102970/g.290875 Transcript_102970/m.290875 type:complete len:85 (+) Transcript_102970:958-1212(+)